MPSELTSSIGRFGLIAAGGYAFGPIGVAVGMRSPRQFLRAHQPAACAF